MVVLADMIKLTDTHKNFLTLIVLTGLVIFFSSYPKIILNYLDALKYIYEIQLIDFFSPSEYSEVISNSLALILVPASLLAVPVLGYWLIKRKQLPYVYHATWVIWLLLISGISNVAIN